MSKTRGAGNPQQLFRVVHPFHPLKDQEFELLYRRHTWGVDRVYFHDGSGRLRSLPAAWTSVVAPDPAIAIAAGRAYFRVEDLCALAALVADLKTAERSGGVATRRQGV